MRTHHENNNPDVRICVRTGTWDREKSRSESRRLRAGLIDVECRGLGQSSEITRSELGKPYLAVSPSLQWSSSSTEGAAGIAWSSSGHVGLDLESKALFSPSDTLLRDSLTPRELDEWGDGLSAQAFVGIWTRKEAALKCLGTGLRLPPNTVQVGYPTDEWTPVTLRSTRVCWVRTLPVGPDLDGAIAFESHEVPGTMTMTRQAVRGEPHRE